MPKNKTLQDLNWREIGLIAPLVFLMVFMGVYPKPFLDTSKDSVLAVREQNYRNHKKAAILRKRKQFKPKTQNQLKVKES